MLQINSIIIVDTLKLKSIKNEFAFKLRLFKQISAKRKQKTEKVAVLYCCLPQVWMLDISEKLKVCLQKYIIYCISYFNCKFK